MLLRISHVEDAHDPRYLLVHRDRSYVIGGGGCDIVLADSTVASRHARLILDGDRIVIEDLGSAAGTFIDDRAVIGPTEVELGQWIRVGETILQVTLGERVPVANLYERRPETAAERAFLASLRANPADDETRAVYADWLESEGCPITARYIHAELAGTVDSEISELVGRALSITAPEWRAVVSRGPIGGCKLPECPRRWHVLDAKHDDAKHDDAKHDDAKHDDAKHDDAKRDDAKRDDAKHDALVRRCGVCHRDVFYCTTRESVARRGKGHALVVFDAGLVRRLAAHAYFEGEFPDLDSVPRHRDPVSQLFFDDDA